MNERIAAEEHLRVIRSLMERATVYRAISAPTALVGGLSALAVSTWLLWRPADATPTRATVNLEFMLAWFGALAVTVAANGLFLWQGARRDSRPFFSSGLRLALRSVVPSLFVAASLTFFFRDGPAAPTALALSWICLYGLALLSTMNFAPRSLSVLGWCFVLTSVLWLLLLVYSPTPLEILRGPRGSTLAMAVTFGFFHLIYAACTWSRGRTADAAPFASE